MTADGMQNREDCGPSSPTTALLPQGKHKVTSLSGQERFDDLTGIPWLSRDLQPVDDKLACQLVGASIRVWWPLEQDYFPGTVASYNAAKVLPADTPL